MAALLNAAIELRRQIEVFFHDICRPKALVDPRDPAPPEVWIDHQFHPHRWTPEDVRILLSYQLSESLTQRSVGIVEEADPHRAVDQEGH